MLDIEEKEQKRLALQSLRDGAKSQAQRNRLGQFATPTALARDILHCAKKTLARRREIRFLDPALGTGSFYSAFLSTFGADAASRAVGFEIDEHYGQVAEALWRAQGLEVRHEDFTRTPPPDDESQKATLVICNPPYVRHHHLASQEKQRLNDCVSSRCGIRLSGLSGLYCYFLCLSLDWMAQDGLAAWLIPSEFMDVNYGRAVKELLLSRVSLLRIHRFLPDDVQFGDALVSSAVVWFKKEKPSEGHRVRFSLGGSLARPSIEAEYSLDDLREERKWTSLPSTGAAKNTGASRFALGHFFDVKRGIATGANEFFILSRSEVERRAIPSQFLTPILPSPRFLRTDRIESDADGIPCIERLGFLFSSDIPEERIRREFPKVWDYLEEGRAASICDRYICRNRNPWYSQERREAASILCTYMGRATGNGGVRPFRFILNRSRAVAANVYLMLYPKPWMKKALESDTALMRRVWEVLQAIPVANLTGEGRVYGGGLHKLEPKELLNTPAEALAGLFRDGMRPHTQMSLF
ncbi:MAG: class I SAM-dependent methyltransferase [Sedimentisphaerales bacterium]|nr:class I SAM-dependent methyltransferase [Sedimentisphaerales bacterium]